MTLVDTETGEVLDVETAEMRASFICTDLDHAADSFETAMDRMRLAISERDDIVLGYRSPGDYLSDRFGSRLARLGVDLRREVVRELTKAGMSVRAIASVADVSVGTVHNDQVFNSEHLQTPEPAAGGEASTGSGDNLPEAEADVSDVPAVSEQDAAPRPPVVGIDGKTYQRPAPKPVQKVDESEWADQDRAEELARSLATHLSLLYAVTNPDRRADFIATWRNGTRDLRPLGSDFVTPAHMRDLASALNDFAAEWENANV